MFTFSVIEPIIKYFFLQNDTVNHSTGEIWPFEQIIAMSLIFARFFFFFFFFIKYVVIGWTDFENEIS